MVFSQSKLAPETREFYCQALNILNQAQMPFLIGGAYAFECYTGISRHTKDLDIFARPSDVQSILDVFAQAGYQTDIAVSHWLAKAYCGENFVDIISNSAHGCLPVSDAWFEHAVSDEVFGIPAKICAPEEIIWSKAYVMARDRFDGADIAHLILACGDRIDWSRLVTQFGDHWRVLFSHLVLFGFIYPGERSRIPAWVMQQLSQKIAEESSHNGTSEKLCQGPLLAPLQYRTDVEQWNYEDARLQPRGNLTKANVVEWIEHLQQEKDTSETCEV
ncbi:nucleotidyltransferase [Leptolyngbya sp. FACHB-16]|uniref:nucleotidyltransferase domain-containing protein n=1 Tax=unclassified Leptolyngbya TaxID=2650499 RepID=UPI0016831F02|nr:nucleotidyltransferase [Leptolyngbya sp. FACHB-16]MBD2153973.1 nucleotidyltransferase [Leptolyngbya sp. FACHB-16]